MKKKLMPILALVLALMMVLTACDSIPGRSNDDDDDRRSSNSEDDDRRDRDRDKDKDKDDDEDKDKDDDDDSRDDDSSSDRHSSSLLQSLWNSNRQDNDDNSQNNNDDKDKDKDDDDDDDFDGESYEGNLGDEMTTAFFKFTVEDAQCYSSLNGHKPHSGYKYLVLDISLVNLQKKSSLPMFGDDFWLVWGPDDGEDAYPEVEKIDDNQLPDEYKVAIGGSKSGTLVYEVPMDMEDFMLVYVEIYEGDEIGDIFYVYFTADDIINPPSGNTPGNDTPSTGDPDDGTTGTVGDTLSTAFFDFTVNGAYYFSSIGNAVPSAGNTYLVLSMTIKNTQNGELPMFDSDFPLLYGADFDSMIYPIEDRVDSDQLPDEYTVPEGQSTSGYLVYEVPKGQSGFFLGYQEIFSSGREGEIYLVFIDAEDILQAN